MVLATGPTSTYVEVTGFGLKAISRKDSYGKDNVRERQDRGNTREFGRYADDVRCGGEKDG